LRVLTRSFERTRCTGAALLASRGICCLWLAAPAAEAAAVAAVAWVLPSGLHWIQYGRFNVSSVDRVATQTFFAAWTARQMCQSQHTASDSAGSCCWSSCTLKDVCTSLSAGTYTR
jgi:hypothetical protein